MTTPPPPLRLVLAVALGGALGALARWGLSDAVPDGSGFPWTTFAINVTGSWGLAALPAIGVVRRSKALTAGFGPGALGGFTTLSTYSEETRGLLADGRGAVAVAYLLGTLGACLVAVALARRWTDPAGRSTFEADEGDE